MDARVARALFGQGTELVARALCLGERIDTRALETTRRLASRPLTLAAGEAGGAVVFRYGVVVLFGLSPVEEASFLANLRPFVIEPFDPPPVEEVLLSQAEDEPEQVVPSGVRLSDFSLERLQVVADILAKSVVLDHYEAAIASAFDRIEPLAKSLQREGQAGSASRELLRQLGGSLLIQHKMVWRAEISEKPEILWDRPELDRLYSRLADEYELRERQLALDRKLALVSQSAQTLIDLLQDRRSLRVEWYIVLLIVVEIALTLYAMFVRG
jgi:uncharacterized Rmd1/YagE family protein